MNWEDQIKQLSQADFNLLEKMVQRNDVINGVQATQLFYLPYKFVKEDLVNLLNEGQFKEVFRVIFRDKINLDKITYQQSFSVLIWVKESFNQINKLEREYLSSPPEPEMIAAGINKLNELGELNVTDTVASRYRYSLEEVERMPYHRVFDLQRKMKLESEIQKELARIREEKARQKRRK